MTPGGYVMQADEINPSGATVVASANTPFEYPDMPAAPPAQAPPRRPQQRRAVVRALAR